MYFKLPELGEGVHEGELVKWRVQPGDRIDYDQPLCEVMTDKATIEIPAAWQGTVVAHLVQEGATVKVGQEMLSYDSQKSPKSSESPKFKDEVVEHHPRWDHVVEKPKVSTSASSNTILAAPSTRRKAREMGIDLKEVLGSGPHGRVMLEDLMKSTAQMSLSMKPMMKSKVDSIGASDVLEERVAFRGLRKKIAEKMRLSKDRAAHFTYVEEADATALVSLRQQWKVEAERQGIKFTYLPLVMKAMAVALKHYPILNTSLDEEKGELVYKKEVHIALSIQTQEGLVAPVVKHVARRSLLELASEIELLVEKARSQKLKMEDLQGSTITLTNAGSIGGLFATPVINYPEVAILGFNKIFRKPVVQVVQGVESIVIRDWTYFSISLDHRVVDGAVGAEFMRHFIRLIENPSYLFLTMS